MEEPISIDEHLHASRQSIVKCDLCHQRTPATRVYFYDRVQDDVTLVVCGHCANQLKKGGEIK